MFPLTRALNRTRGTVRAAHVTAGARPFKLALRVNTITSLKFQYSIKNCGNFLTILASGAQTNADEIIDYAKNINSACKREGCSYVLLDERMVTIQTNIEDEVNVSNFVAFHQNLPQVTKMACVPKKVFESNAYFFLYLASAKHFNFKVFHTIDEAAKWLSE